MKPLQIRLITLSVIILTTALFRIVPHWPNFTPVAAVALFGAATFERKWLGLVVPFLAMLLSDLIIGFHNNMGAVYSSIFLTWLIGLWVVRNPNTQRPAAGRIAIASLIASILFFLITNFAVWYGSSYYPQTVPGLMGCYAAGLAFYNGTSFFLNGVLGDLFFSGILFGGYYLLQQRFWALRTVRK